MGEGRHGPDRRNGLRRAVPVGTVYLGGSRESIVEAVKDSVGAWKDDDIKNLVLNVCIKTAEGGRQKVQSSLWISSLSLGLRRQGRENVGG